MPHGTGSQHVGPSNGWCTAYCREFLFSRDVCLHPGIFFFSSEVQQRNQGEMNCRILICKKGVLPGLTKNTVPVPIIKEPHEEWTWGGP